MRFMKRVLIFCFIELLIFTAFACGYECIKGQSLSESLIQWHYTVFGIELGAAAFMKIAEIKVDKIKNKANNTDESSEESEGEDYNE